MYNLHVVKMRRFWYGLSLTLAIISIGFIATGGLKFGLDFTGGSLLEVSYAKDRPSVAEITDILKSQKIENARVQPSQTADYIIRVEVLNEVDHQAVLNALKEKSVAGNKDNIVTENRFESIGPTLGSELKTRSIYSILLVIAAIVTYLAYAFRKVTRPVAAWKFGAAAVVALAHDVIILIGVFAFLGHFYSTEVDSLFVTALLTLLGFSVHDTIVTIDRVRENLFKQQDLTFENLVDRSINETFARSINTSLATLITISAIYFFGGPSVKDFSFALMIGIIVGTYSSIFIASPLLVTAYKLSRRTAK